MNIYIYIINWKSHHPNTYIIRYCQCTAFDNTRRIALIFIMPCRQNCDITWILFSSVSFYVNHFEIRIEQLVFSICRISCILERASANVTQKVIKWSALRAKFIKYVCATRVFNNVKCATRAIKSFTKTKMPVKAAGAASLI